MKVTNNLGGKIKPLHYHENCIKFIQYDTVIMEGFRGGSVIKNLPADAADSASIPESGRSPGEGNGNLLQYSCLENPVDRGV